MNYNQTIHYLNNLEKIGTKLGLSRIKLLLKKLGNPEKDLKIVHVAGTNGKGSVCAMLSYILTEAGYKVGMFTSPHLVDFKERIQINNKNISTKDIVKYFLKVKPFIKKTKATYFEVVTAFSLLYFKEKKVDILLLEVGLGGRLDATNAIKPLIAVITNITKEHTEYLGDTVDKIAFEKAGIIKKNCLTVTAAKSKALSTIKKIAKKRNSKLFIVKKPNKKLKLSLKGDFQYENATIALKVIELLKDFKITKTHVKKGLIKTRWPGRLDFNDSIILDCAHNSASALVLKKEIKKLDYKKLILVIGILKDKDIKSMMKELVSIADFVIVTKANSKRAADPRLLAQEVMKYKKDFIIIEDVKHAFQFAKKIKQKNDKILITGSMYVVGEVI